MTKTMMNVQTETILTRKYIVRGVEKVSLWLKPEGEKGADVDFYRVTLDSIKLSDVANMDSLHIHLPRATGGYDNPQPQIGDVWEVKAEK